MVYTDTKICVVTLSRFSAVAPSMTHMRDPWHKFECHWICSTVFGMPSWGSLRVPRETGAHCLKARERAMATKITDNAPDIVARALLVTTFSGSAPQYSTAASAQSSKVGKLFKLPPQPP